MRKWMLAAGAAALAVTAPALADAQDRGGGRAKAERAQQADRGGGKAVKAARAQRSEARGGGQDRQIRLASAQTRRGGDDDRARGREARAAARTREARAANAETRRARADNDTRRVTRAERGRDRVVMTDRDVNRVVVADRDRDRVAVRGRPDVRVVGTRIFDDDDVRIVRRTFDRDRFRVSGLGLIDGCPPGLFKKDNGCLPPGLARRFLGARLPAAFTSSLVPLGYRTWFRDDDDFLFRAGDGYIYRVDRDRGLIDGIIPLFGNGYYAVGDPWPSPYNFYNVPYQYRTYWADDDDDCYRYAYGAIYEVDCDNGLVEAIVALLTGGSGVGLGGLGVGSRLPLGYDVYNVPLAFRPTYYDTPDVWYRYSDNYIYRVDPETRLITAVIDALV